MATVQTILEYVLLAIPQFCFGYPFVMAWYWIAGALMFYIVREIKAPPQTEPPALDHWPPMSIIVPCYNESDNAEETLRAEVHTQPSAAKGLSQLTTETRPIPLQTFREAPGRRSTSALPPEDEQQQQQQQQ